MRKIDDALKSNECSVMKNPDRAHAKVLIMKLLENAREEVIIFCHRLARDVYGSEEVCDALIKAYQNHPSLNVKVYIRDDAPDFSPFVSILLNKGVRIQCGVNTEHESIGNVILTDGESGYITLHENTFDGQVYFNDVEKIRRIRGKLLNLFDKNKETKYE